MGRSTREVFSPSQPMPGKIEPTAGALTDRKPEPKSVYYAQKDLTGQSQQLLPTSGDSSLSRDLDNDTIGYPAHIKTKTSSLHPGTFPINPFAEDGQGAT